MCGPIYFLQKCYSTFQPKTCPKKIVFECILSDRDVFTFDIIRLWFFGPNDISHSSRLLVDKSLHSCEISDELLNDTIDKKNLAMYATVVPIFL